MRFILRSLPLPVFRARVDMPDEPTKARLVFTKGKLFAKPADPVGQHPLGKTQSGKDVYLSGAETDGYDDADHQDAAALHHRAHRYHATAAEEHGKIADTHQQWKVSEEHHRERERHTRLADHHHELMKDHLIAGGHGGSLELDVNGTKPKVSKLAPHTAKERAEAAKRLKARDHHAHPGDVMERDRAAYAALMPPEKLPGKGPQKPPREANGRAGR